MTDARDLRPRDRSRAHDLVLYGATGFTGRLVAEYLLEHYGDSDLRFALAGRNEGKLQRVRSELARKWPKAAELPTLVADSRDRAALDAITEATSVLCTTVGPYAKYGAEVVASCAEHGTDYCDLTGETLFIHRMMKAHHERAVETGARIVNCCGYDSIPSDLGTLMVQAAAMEKHGTPCREVKYFAGETSGGASGGTLASGFHMAEEIQRDPSVRRVMGDPYALDPPGGSRGLDGADQRGMRHDADLNQWTAPFVMAGINTRVVRRSHALAGYPWGRDFRYSEVMSTGGGHKGFVRAAVTTLGLGAFVTGMALPFTRRILQRRLAQPGEGPSESAREKGYFVVRLLGLGRDGEGRPFTVRAKVRGEKDPGYGSTAIMLGEAAVCLALDGHALEGEGGLGTPASTMGQTLVQRLRDAGMTFAIES